MEDLAMRIAVFVAVGLASGSLSGLFGVGGGIIRIPIFLHLLPLFGVAHALVMHISVGTPIALVIPSAMAATWKQVGLGNLDLKFYRTWAVGVLVGALVGNVLLPY
ncbi:MAG: TSUP family transporter, partial [Xanthobacteraceae bacterium]